MPKINVYLPDDLAGAVRQAGLSVSPICQRALVAAVRVVAEAREAAAALGDPAFELQQHPEIGDRLAARMTSSLRWALQLAREVAGPQRPVASEHLLIGLIDEADNLGLQVLQSLHVDVSGLREAAASPGSPRDRQPTPRGARANKPRSRQGRDHPRDRQPLSGLSISARVAIAAAVDGAIDLGHEFLGCEHLLLGLAEQADGAAAELLRERGIDAERIRRAIPAALGAAALGYRHATETLGPTAANRLDDVDRRLDEIEQRLHAGGL